MDCVVTGSFAEDARDRVSTGELKIVCWNIARGERFDDVLAFLRQADADLIMLQEVDQACRRTDKRDVTVELARALRMHFAFGVEFEELSQGTDGTPALHGQATLARWPLVDARCLRFVRQSSFWRPAWWIPNLPALQRRNGGRMALVAEVTTSGLHLVAYNVHLESRGSDELRRTQLSELLTDLGRQVDRHAVGVIAGDFNFDLVAEEQHGMLFDAGINNQFLGCGLTTAPKREGEAIDCMLTKGDVRVTRATIHRDVHASDHYPLSMCLSF